MREYEQQEELDHGDEGNHIDPERQDLGKGEFIAHPTELPDTSNVLEDIARPFSSQQSRSANPDAHLDRHDLLPTRVGEVTTQGRHAPRPQTTLVELLPPMPLVRGCHI